MEPPLQATEPKTEIPETQLTPSASLAALLSERLLACVQSFDARSNSFPSMHVSVATLTSLQLQPHFGAAAFAFPVLVGLSCLFTKQHYVVDLPPGAVLGWTVYRIYSWFT